MNSEEKIYAWKPIEGLAGKFNIQSACRDTEGFRVIMARDEIPTKECF